MRKLLLVLGVLLLAGAVYLVARNYYIGTVREEVESVVGELDQAGITMRTADAQSGQALLEKLRGAENGSFGLFKLDKVVASKNSIKIEALFDGKKYPIEIYWEEIKPKPPLKPKAQVEPKPKPLGPRLAIVIDDMGANLAVAREFFDLPFPFTPAVLPYLAHSTEVARLSAEHKRPFLLHMPMEPKGYPAQKPGEGAIMTGDSPEKVRSLVAKALESVPGAYGINNHMGSKATESKALMTPVMAELSKRGMFFLDSETSTKSVAAEMAKTAGLPWAARNVFLDNEGKVAAIEAQISLAATQAKKNGQAIAIGHGRPETLKALRNWSEKFDVMGVKIVPVNELLHAGGETR